MTEIHRDTITPGESASRQLEALGVSGEQARAWGCIGPTVSATLWRSGAVAVFEAHRSRSAQRVIEGWSLLHSAGSAQIREAVARIVDEISAQSASLPLVKAVIRGEDDILRSAVRERGFSPVEGVHSPFSLEKEWEKEREGLSVWVKWNAPELHPPTYERQKTEFTCGAACALMATATPAPEAPWDLSDELPLWREATYSLGIGPHGLAAVLAQAGKSVRVLTTNARTPIVGVTKATIATPDVRQKIHEQHLHRGEKLGVSIEEKPLTLSDMTNALSQGRRLLILVDLSTLNGEDTPHWVYAWGMSGDYVMVHDPWYDEQFGETWATTWAQPIDAHHLWEAAHWEEKRDERAFLIID